MASSTAVNLRVDASLPGSDDHGEAFCPCSQAGWVLVVNSPRD
jgi:hypothetical protein